MEGSATEGAWVGREARGVGAGREDGGERDGRVKMEARREAHGWGGKKEGSGRRTWVWTGWGGKMEGSETAWLGCGRGWGVHGCGRLRG